MNNSATITACTSVFIVNVGNVCRYLIDPAIESRHAGEDGRFPDVVAAQPGHEASDAVHLPDSKTVPAVQGPTRVTLQKGTNHT